MLTNMTSSLASHVFKVITTWSQVPVVTFGAIEVGGAGHCGADVAAAANLDLGRRAEWPLSLL